MKKIITCCSFVLAAAAVNAQHDHAAHAAPAAAKPVTVQVQAAAPPQAETLVLKEAEFNFGKIPQGKPVTHVFEISNSGKDSLKITNVQAGCGCTTPEWEKDKLLAPGASTKITVGFNAATEGPFNKPVTITYNGSQSKVLFIKGEVWKTPATSAPENKGLGDLKN
jgi:Protein of unknown function (DUF1573)